MRIVQPERTQYFKDYWVRNKEKMYKQKIVRCHQRRRELLLFLGGKCKRCGFNDQRALQIDHKKGGGNREVKSMGGNILYSLFLYKMMRLYPQEFLEKYQLLCANCNLIKGRK